MASELDELAGPERRLCEVLAAYFEADKAGEAPERAAWLDRHPDLADQLAAFLDEQDRLLRMTEPLRTIAEAAGGPDPGDAAAAGRDIGDYELLGEIDRGGMGVVYRARQRGLNRLVALKMLRSGSLPDGDDARRFRLEAEAVAQLDHPNIVPIHEVGEHDGSSYFAMKLIEGTSLAHRPPGPAADPHAAARIVAVVARAVHHAHQRGVLHRDLKPSNILIDTEGRPHVTDFGLARRIEGDSELTQSGAILGTPAYMAPEQASGRRKAVTTATDVYGLGAVLYALLTGKPPFRGDSVFETLERVRQAPPEPPGGVDRDLETICLKCLEKEPERRYASALAVAEDLERWLGGEPIQARPVRGLERAWLWCRRNRAVAGLVASTAVLLVALVVGAGAGILLLLEERGHTRQALDLEREQRQKAQASAAAAEESRARAQRRSERALGQVNGLFFELMSRRWSGIPGIGELRSRVARRAIDTLELTAAECRADPTRSLEHAFVLDQLASIYAALGAYAESREVSHRIIALHEARRAEAPPDDMQALVDLASAQWAIASSFAAEERSGEALPLFREALATFRRRWRARPGDARAANLLAWFLATCPCAELREPDQAVAIAREAVASAPKSASYRNTLGVALLRAGDPKAALATLEEAMALKGGGDAFDWFFLAMACWDLGRRDDARSWYDRAAEWTVRESPEHLELRLLNDEAAAKLGRPRPAREPIAIPPGPAASGDDRGPPRSGSGTR